MTAAALPGLTRLRPRNWEGESESPVSATLTAMASDPTPWLVYRARALSKKAFIAGNVTNCCRRNTP